jgi:hypothetical protein
MGRAGMNIASVFDFVVAVFIESTSMHEKPETAHVMEDGGAERSMHTVILFTVTAHFPFL